MGYQQDIWVAIYVRLSAEDRDKRNESDDSNSIQNQKSMLTSYAERHGWKIYDIYNDDDYSGADRNRPEYNRLLRDAEERKFQVVLCKTQARFTREIEHVEHYLHGLFPIWGIRFVGMVDDADTDNKRNLKARQINGLVNEWYLADLSDNIKSVLTERREKGFHIGAFCAYGYQKDPEQKGHLIPDPEAAEVVHMIFEWFAGGLGKTSIARKLNELGIPNPTEYKLLKGIRKRKQNSNRRSSLWQYFSVSEILTNEVYIGNLVQGKYESISYKTHQSKPRPKEKWIRVCNTHEPIIERELWDKVQAIIALKAKPGWTGEVGTFARIVKCMYCGYTMRTAKKCDDTQQRYFRCSTANVDKNACRGGFISLKNLEKIVLEELHKMIDTYLDMDAAEEMLQIRDDNRKRLEQLKQRLGEYQRKVRSFDMTFKTLYEDRVAGIITTERYAALSDQFAEEQQHYTELVRNVQKQIDELNSQQREEVSKREILQHYANVTELNYQIVHSLIDYIEVGRREGHYRYYDVPVVIHWKF